MPAVGKKDDIHSVQIVCKHTLSYCTYDMDYMYDSAEPHFLLPVTDSCCMLFGLECSYSYVPIE